MYSKNIENEYVLANEKVNIFNNILVYGDSILIEKNKFIIDDALKELSKNIFFEMEVYIFP